MIPTIVQSIENENVSIQGYNESCSLTWERLWFKYIAREFLGKANIGFTDMQGSICCLEFNTLDKRKGFQICAESGRVRGFLDALRYQHCSEQFQLSLKRPDDNFCVQQEDTTAGCRNFPELLCTIDENGCIQTILGGVNNSVVLGATFEADLFDPITGQFPGTYDYPVTSTSIISGEICNAPCAVKILSLIHI